MNDLKKIDLFSYFINFMFNDKYRNKVLKYENRRFLTHINKHWGNAGAISELIFKQIHEIIKKYEIKLPIIKNLTDDYIESIYIKKWESNEDEEDDDDIPSYFDGDKNYQNILKYLLQDFKCFEDHSNNIVN